MLILEASKHIDFLGLNYIYQCYKNAIHFFSSRAIKNLPGNAGDTGGAGLILGWEDHTELKWQATPVFLPGKSHAQRGLVAYSPWGHKSWT